MGWTVVPHLTNSADLTTSEFLSFGPLKDELREAVLRAMTSRHTACVKGSGTSAKMFLHATSVQCLTQSLKKCGDSERVFAKISLKFLKDVPIICIYFCILLLHFSQKNCRRHYFPTDFQGRCVK
jgi:hypothetical protein